MLIVFLLKCFALLQMAAVGVATLFGSAPYTQPDALALAPGLSATHVAIAVVVAAAGYYVSAAATKALGLPGLSFAEGMYDALEGCDALLICTDWNDYRSPSLARVQAALKGDWVFDGRNLLNPDEVRSAGLRYSGIGRGR